MSHHLPQDNCFSHNTTVMTASVPVSDSRVRLEAKRSSGSRGLLTERSEERITCAQV